MATIEDILKEMGKPIFLEGWERGIIRDALVTAYQLLYHLPDLPNGNLNASPVHKINTALEIIDRNIPELD